MLAIIIPFFKLTFFEETLESLTNQTDKRFKVYIGDDASSEDCSAIIENYREKIDLVYHRFESNLGSISLTKQWNRCVELSQNEKWLMLLGDDDVLGNNVVQEFYNFINSTNKDPELIRLDLRVIDGKGEIKSQTFYHDNYETSEKLLDQMLLMKETITASEFIFRRDVYNKNQGFVEFPLAWFSDYATWLVFSKDKGIFYIKNASVYWRLSEYNISSVLSNENNIGLKIKSLFMFMYFLQSNYNIDKKRSKHYTHSQLVNFFGNISDFVKIRILSKELFKFKYRLADIIIIEFIFERLKRKKIKKLWKYLYRI
ncbi:glycosyltransferase family 2 protein [Flavobacterium phragmitis]|uniref:Glycosyltransferase, GT2 family n=1 Tax=Flavobacterium phragmitis TaxID=739143 RepID=A0A1I1UST9_9FLAO|nr:glycosyltransferase [Flavobacterium phragmitis]SFD72738.1 Glycosyltransferase, GT2 family [Flavobacterium phragmitis]